MFCYSLAFCRNGICPLGVSDAILKAKIKSLFDVSTGAGTQPDHLLQQQQPAFQPGVDNIPGVSWGTGKTHTEFHSYTWNLLCEPTMKRTRVKCSTVGEGKNYSSYGHIRDPLEVNFTLAEVRASAGNPLCCQKYWYCLYTPMNFDDMLFLIHGI